MAYNAQNSKNTDLGRALTGEEVLQASLNSGQSALRVEPVAPDAAGTPGAYATTVQGIGGNTRFSFARTADITAYAAGDVIGINNAGSAGSAIHAITTIGPAAGHIFITDVNFEIDITAVVSGMTSFKLHLYNASPDAIVDNVAWDLSSAGDRTKYLGFVDLGVPVDVGSTLYVQNIAVNKKIKLAAASTTLYAQLQTVGAWTPASGSVFVIDIHTVAV